MMPPARSTILIADDEPSIRETAGYILESEGYTVLLAANGEEALSLIRSRRPAAVLLDIEMPRKNGLQVCQEVKGDPSLRSTYIILLTARGQKKDEVEGLAAGRSSRRGRTQRQAAPIASASLRRISSSSNGFVR